MNAKQDYGEDINRLWSDVHDLLFDVKRIKDHLAKQGVVRFMSREQLETSAAKSDPCPACGHRRTKDG